jgi:HAD superfamily hydrolase (TIGR01509 family)
MGKHLRGVILDVDGTLIDSNGEHAEAWVEAFRQHGYDVPYDKALHMIGMGSDNLLPKAVGVQKDSPEGQALSKASEDIFKAQYLSHIRAFPQTRALLLHMRDQGLRLAVASSAKKDQLHQLLEIAGAADLIETKTSSGDVKNSKPDPDIVHAALTRLDLAPDEVVMIGDTPYDIEAAGKLGIGTIAFRSGGWDDAGLAGAIAIYDDPADLLAHYAESPLASAAPPSRPPR